jgi:XXXCH domain-containing protein
MNEQQQHEFKMVKRRLSAVQRVIKMDLKDGQLPRQADAADFVASSQAMERLGDRRWRTAMDAYMVDLERFESAMANGDLQATHDCFQDLLDAKAACHKEFR